MGKLAFNVVILISIFCVQPALSGGFAIREQSASAQGAGFSGAVTLAEDPSYMFFNPAAATMFDELTVTSGISLIYVPSDIQVTSFNILTTPVEGQTRQEDVGELGIVPNFSVAMPLNDKFSLGFSLNAPFGLALEYDRDWVGRYHAVRTELFTLNAQPVIAYKAMENLSFAVGLQVEYAKAELSNAVDLGLIAATTPGVAGAAGVIPVPSTLAQDGFAVVEGDGFAYGFTLGALWEPVPGTRIGASYRSELDHKLKGDAEFSSSTADGAAILGVLQAGGSLTNSSVTAAAVLPATATLGISHQLTPNLTVMGSAEWAQWSSFDELRVQFANPLQPDNVTTENWDDSWFLALGARYTHGKQTYRLGVGYEETPVPDATRTPRIPDNDRIWLSAGLNWQLYPGVELDAAFTHIILDDPTLALGISGPADENASRGTLAGSYDTSINILGLSGTIRF